MRTLTIALLLAALSVHAQETDDPFAAFDEAFEEFDEGFAEDERGLPWSGFVETAYGRRLDSDPAIAGRQTLGDVRLRLETDWSNDSVRWTFKGDALYDEYESELDGDVRELSLQFSPIERIDLKVGRQVLTWGTGDLLFLNDLFPKSWISFFSGREDEYLKAPSNTLRMTWYSDRINVDVAWSPTFEPDEYLTGGRFSFFSPLAGRVVAPDPPLAGQKPSRSIENGEVAVRLFKTVGSTEYAAYLYRGFFKQPVGLDASLAPVFPALSVYGASLRRPLGRGLVNLEAALYDSRSDRRGTDPLTPNDQGRLLVGYEFELVPRLTVGFQYYLEATRDYGALVENSLAPQFEPDRHRSVLTNRLTYRTRRDRLTLSLFAFVSPSDDDHYLRPSVIYRQSDRWTLSAGANLFSGDRDHTFFGQLEEGSNVWFRIRYSY